MNVPIRKKMGKLSRIWGILWETPQQKVAAEESAAIRAKNSQIKTLLSVNEYYAEEVNDLTKQLKMRGKANMEDRLMQLAEHLLIPKKDLSASSVGKVVEIPTANQGEIIDQFLKENPAYKEKIKKKSKEELQELRSMYFPDVTEEAFEMVIKKVKAE